MMGPMEDSERAQSGSNSAGEEGQLNDDHHFNMLENIQARIEDKRADINWREEVNNITTHPTCTGKSGSCGE